MKKILGLTPLEWIAALMAVLAAIGGGSVKLPIGIPENVAAILTSWDSFLSNLWVIVLPFILHQREPAAVAPAPPEPHDVEPAKISGTGTSLPAILIFVLLLAAPSFAWAADLPPRAAHARIIVPPFHPPAPVASVTLQAALEKLTDTPGLIDQIIADLKSMDSVAGAVNPDSPYPAPYNIWNPYAHACAAPAIAWLQSFPSKTTVPAPTPPGGVLTTIVVAGAQIDALQGFIGKLVSNGIPPGVRIGCDSFVQWILRSPARVQANITADVAAFITLFH